MLRHDDWWFDGDYGECYWAPGHVSKIQFAIWVTDGADGVCDPMEYIVQAKDVEHVYVLNVSENRFIQYKPRGDEYDDIKARIAPMTVYRP